MSHNANKAPVRSASNGRPRLTSSQRKVSSAGKDRVGEDLDLTSTAKKPPASSRMKMPSDRLNPKVVDPFQKKSGAQSKFASLYSSGLVPCRLMHGSVSHKLHWDTAPEDLNFDPTLVNLAEGLRENRHPYFFIAREGFKQMLSIPDAEHRTVPLLGRLMSPLRLALGSSNADIFKATLNAVVQLSSAVGPALNPHLKTILPLLGKQILSNVHKEDVTSALQAIEFNGGKECVTIIKSRIPTYSSVFR